MSLQFGTTAALTNTQFAPVAVLMASYEAQNVFKPLQSVTSAATKGDFTLADKLEQVVWSILTDCEYISVVNTKLRPERTLAQVKRIGRFAEQSTLAMALDELTQMNLQQLVAAVRQISDRCSRTRQHDWRGFLLLDFDLSGLPCGKQAEESHKGHFSGKKTSPAGN
ncbi:MAG: hypothetical protein AB1791_18200 [Chloroflexota bacterium]